jgi:hypothetical protein
MTTDVKLSETETPELLDEEGAGLADGLEAEGVNEGSDQRKKDNRWHSFETL